jgi:hypothetical protein
MLSYTSLLFWFCQLLILKTCRLYNVFGSGAQHAIYAFMVQSSLYNKGRLVGLLQGAGTQFATWFYAMHQALHLRQVLLSTIHQQKFLELESVKKQSVQMAIQDIEEEVLEVTVYSPAFCFSCPKSSSFLGCQQTGDGQHFLSFPQDNTSY